MKQMTHDEFLKRMTAACDAIRALSNEAEESGLNNGFVLLFGSTDSTTTREGTISNLGTDEKLAMLGSALEDSLDRAEGEETQPEMLS